MYLLKDNPGRTTIINGKEYLFFSGYSYLGMNHVPEFLQLVKEGIDKYGLIFPSSRISNTRLDLYNAFEDVLSKLTNSEETICFSSGFMAGKVAVSLFDKVYTAPDAHPSIRKENTPNISFLEWTEEIANAINLSHDSKAFIIAADAVNPLTATLNDFYFLQQIKKNIIVIIDDSHGIGLTGKEGSGISSGVPLKDNIEYIFTYSLSKAFGLIGGAISCSKKMAHCFRSSHEYTASTSIAPAYMYAFSQAQEIYQKQRKRLFENILYFNKLIDGLNIIHHPELPVYVLNEKISAEQMFDNSVIISSFAYPDVEGDKINRIVLNALHTKEDLDYLNMVLRRFLC